MGTRSIIFITGKKYGQTSSYRLYKHWDGYPSENLSLIAKAIKNADCLRHFAEQPKIAPESLAGCLVGESTSAHGIGARIEEHYWDEFKPEQLGNQGDLEWIYTIDTEANTVRVFESKFGQSPQEALKKGHTDPMSFARRVRKEYYSETAKEISDAVNQIEASGFRVNPKESTYGNDKRHLSLGAQDSWNDFRQYDDNIMIDDFIRYLLPEEERELSFARSKKEFKRRVRKIADEQGLFFAPFEIQQLCAFYGFDHD